MIVTHNMQQAQRVSDRCAFFLAAENEPGLRRRAGPDREDVLEPRRPAHARLRRRPVRMMRTVGRGRRRRGAARGVAAVAGAARARPSWRPLAVAIGRRAGDGAAGQHQRLRLDLRRAGHAAVGRRRRRPAASRSTTCRPARPTGLTVVRQRPHRLRRHRGRVLARSAAAAASQRRGYQYVPDVAGAVAVMYNVAGHGRPQGRLPAPVATHDRPHLHRATSRNWNDPAITADNKGLVAARPADHRRVPRRPVGHDRRSSTTSSPTSRRTSSARGRRATSCRPTCASSSSTARRASRPRPRRSQRLGPDRAVRRQRRRASGRSATTSSATPRRTTLRPRGCRTRPGTGCCRTPQNISAALESATLRPDLSQELSGVYASPNPQGVPDLGVQLHRDAVRTAPRPRHVQGDLRQRGHHRDADEVVALHRVRRPGEHGPDRLLAAAAEPLAGDRQLDRRG